MIYSHEVETMCPIIDAFEVYILERSFKMIYSHEVETMCPVAQGVNHGAAPIPEDILERSFKMIYSHEVETMCPVAQGVNHGAAPIPEEAKWVKAKEIKDISGLTHGVGWCAPQQGTCKLTLNVKEGIIQEALVETIGCSGMTHSAAMASEILPGRTILEALNTDLVCDAINTAMRELFLQIVYGRTQSAFSEDGLPIGAGLEDLGKGLRSQRYIRFNTRCRLVCSSAGYL